MISKVVTGYLFTINGYLPMMCTLTILILATLISTQFIEPNKKAKVSLKEASWMKEISDIKSGFKFVLKSERLKALILSAAFISTLLTILDNYEVNL